MVVWIWYNGNTGFTGQKQGQELPIKSLDTTHLT